MLVDGGIVNPVPTSLARAMGADIVIAVDLNADILQRHMQPLAVEDHTTELQAAAPESGAEPVPATGWKTRLRQWLPSHEVEHKPKPPSVLDVVMTSVAIMQMRITRSRMAGDPPELVISPSLAHLGLLDFHRSAEAIEEGRRAAQAALPRLRRFMTGA